MPREDFHTEFKRTWTDETKCSVIAFANCDGGTIWIGVADDGTFSGIDNPDEEILRIQNTLRDSIAPDIMMFVQCSFVEKSGAIAIRIDVHRGTRRPYFLRNKGIRPEGVFVRQGPSTVPASFDAIRRMLIESGDSHYENAVSFEQDLSFNFARDFFVQREVALGTTQMRSLKFINEDGLYTNLARLLSEQCEHTIKAAVFQGKRKNIFRDRAEFSGSVLKQLEDAYSFIVRHNNLHACIEGLNRIDTYDYPLTAVREGLLNAIVHRDYGASGPILISIFDDRLEILNQGGLMPSMSIAEVRRGISDPRNKALAAVFYRLKLIEAYGTGYDKIDGSYEGTGKHADISVTQNSFLLTLPNVNYVEHGSTSTRLETPASGIVFQDRLAECFSRPSPVVPSEKCMQRRRLVIDLCKRHGAISRPEIQKAAGISQTAAIVLIRSMLESGELVKVGKGKETRYTLPM